MLDPRRLLTFREVARQRSFSRAADALSLTQPAVSQQIRALETQLGTKLIERGRASFALTAVGELLLEHAQALYERLQLADSQLSETLTGMQRQLRIGAFPSALGVLVPPAIAAITTIATLPGLLEVQATQGDTRELVAGVRDGTLHVALCFQDASEPRREHDGTRRIDLWDEPMLAALGPGHRLATRTRIRLDDLAEDPWLVGVRGGLIERACLAAGFQPRIAYVTDDPAAIEAIVAADLGVTLTSRMLARHFHAVPTVALVGEGVRRAVYALVPPVAQHPLTDAFVASVRRWPS
jgi:DNA-binding transcriptional LysR family regulator